MKYLSSYTYENLNPFNLALYSIGAEIVVEISDVL